MTFTCDFCVQLQEFLKGQVGREALDPIIGNSVFSTAFWTFDLSLDIIHKTFHTWLHTIGVLTWQQFRRAKPVQADAAGQQLVELIHLELVTGATFTRKSLGNFPL